MFALGHPELSQHPAVVFDKLLDIDGVVWPKPPEQTFEWYMDLLTQQRVQTLEWLQTLADPDKVIQGKTKSFTIRWILGHLVQHDAYHGGQAVLLHESYKKEKLQG
jgi:hypothetical protein